MVDLRALNPQQRLAAETICGPLLILAGAGTGKTRVITYRMAHLVDCGIAPGHILGVTFTNKAAREMKERVAQLIRRPGPRPTANTSDALTLCTFHSLGVRILRQFIDRLGYKNHFVIYDEADQLGVVKKILSRLSARGEKADPQAILALISRLKNAGANPRGFADDASLALAEHVRSRYDTALHACNAVDFDDLILLTLKLLQEHPDVLEACRARYRYVMVDEYQDTNATQFQFVHLLTREHQNLCVVGDDDQSIYGWRGAEINNLLELEKFYPQVKIIKLEQNYRSTNTILQAANALIKHNVRRRPKQLWSAKGPGVQITLRLCASDEDEARAVVEDLECDRLARRIPWSSQAVLFRTNGQSRPLEAALRQAGVRYRLIGGQSFFDRREIRDFLAYGKTLINPHDDNSLLRIVNLPARGLSEATMERLLAASHERHCSVYAAMQEPGLQSQFGPKTRESLAAFLELIRQQRTALEGGPGISLRSWAEGFLQHIGYFDELRRSEKKAESGENRVRNLLELLAMLEETEGKPGSPLVRLQGFLEELTLDAERLEERETKDNAVTLITMHSCKGLEFPHVHVVGLEDGLLPHARSKAEGTLDEERRLCYVAITRAMETLSLSHCQTRKKYGQIIACHPSPFLQEIPGELLMNAEEKDGQVVAQAQAKDLFAAMRAALGQ